MQEALSIEGAGCKKIFFCQGVVVQEHYQLRGQGAKPFFRFDTFFLISNLKILPI